jgi:chromosome segregation ATPase
MNTSQPTKDVLLPKDIQEATEKARENITVLTAELSRLDKIVRNQSREINDKHSSMVFIDSEIEGKNTKIDTLKIEIGKLENVLSDLQTKKDNTNKQIEDLQVSISTKEKEFKIRESEILRKEQNVEVSIKNVDAREKIVTKRENKIDEFVKDLKVVITKHSIN